MRAVRHAPILAAGGTLLWMGACAAPPPAAAPLPPPPASPPVSALPMMVAPSPPAPPPPPADVQPEDQAAPPAPRIGSRGYVTWIYGRPRADKRYIGYLRYGGTLPLRSSGLTPGPGCPGGFHAIEPRGYVCHDRTVILDPPPPFTTSAEATAPVPGPFPYRYALSNGTPMYNRVPTPAEQARFERPFGPAGKWIPLSKGLSAHEDLATPSPIAPTDPLLPFLENGGLAAEGRLGLVRQNLPLGSMLSFSRSFAVEGRTFLLSADQTLVPADRVRPFRPSTFRGQSLDATTRLPIAWIRGKARPRYRSSEALGIEPAEGAFPLRTPVPLTGASRTQGGIRYLETRERDSRGDALYIAEPDATVVEALRALPPGVAAGQKMIVVRITQGTLVAYQGLEPVFTTLMSPGAGGVPVKGNDPVKASTTPLGVYYVTFKDRAATMSPEQGENRKFWIADVPHIQYFNPPFALHAAYWHERFGEPTSAGCINVSPTDAETLFQWSDPVVPEGWQGVTGAGAKENGATTAIVVLR